MKVIDKQDSTLDILVRNGCIAEYKYVLCDLSGKGSGRFERLVITLNCGEKTSVSSLSNRTPNESELLVEGQ